MRLLKKYGVNTVLLAPRGFASLIEMIIVMGILVLLMTIGIFGITNITHTTSLNTTLDVFKTDFKNQQLKAMLGDTETGSAPDNYGISFETDRYVLFRGIDPDADPDKFVIDLPPTIEVTTFFLNDNIIFLKGDGEIAGCCTANTITFKDVEANIEKTISVNRYGVFTVN